MIEVDEIRPDFVPEDEAILRARDIKTHFPIRQGLSLSGWLGMSRPLTG